MGRLSGRDSGAEEAQAVGQIGRLIKVPFAGEGSGVDDLTWGQQNIWGAIQRSGGALNTGGMVEMPPSTTVEDMVKTLRYLVSRHATLRTRLRFTPDGRTQQVLSDSGEATLEVVDVEDVDPVELVERFNSNDFVGDNHMTLANPQRPSPAEVAQAVMFSYRYEFDEENEWPIRMAVIRAGGVVTHLVVMYNHVAVDGEALAVIIRDLSNMDPDTGAATAPPPGPTPLELAALQRTPNHRRRSAAALQHWADLLRTIPARRFGDPMPPKDPRYWEITFNSPAAHLAGRVLEDRLRVNSSPLVLAAFAIGLYRITGNSPTVAQIHINNRFRPGLADAVTPLNQPALYVLDVADVGFTDVVAAARRSTMVAGMHSYYDVSEWEKVKAAIAEERGEDIDLSCFYNDRRTNLDRDDSPLPSADEIQAALSRTTWSWRRLVRPNERLYFHVNDAPGALEVLVPVDTVYVSPEDTMRLVHEIEAILVDEAVRASSEMTAAPAAG